MRTSASPGPGGSMVNSSTTPGSPGSRAMTPRATIDPLPLLPEDSATVLLLISYRDATEAQLGRADDTPFRNRCISFGVAHPVARRTRIASPLDAHRVISYDPVVLHRQSWRIPSCAEESPRGGNHPKGVRPQAQAGRVERLHLLARQHLAGAATGDR